MLRSSLFLGIFILLLATCREDAANTIDPTVDIPPGTMLIERDSQLFLSNFNNALIAVGAGDESGRIMNIRVRLDGGDLVLSIVNWDWQIPPSNGIVAKVYDLNQSGRVGNNTSCQEINGSTLCDTGTVTYSIDNATYFSQFVTTGEAGTITITSIDNAQRTISGTFDATMQLEDQPDQIRFEGGFNQIPYFVF